MTQPLRTLLNASLPLVHHNREIPCQLREEEAEEYPLVRSMQGGGFPKG